ncbi:MAG: class I tRNA ligase family protein, partial [Patescibacteria group bacterium]
IARDRIVSVLGRDVEVLEEVTGDRLLNISYKGPFDSLPAVDSARREKPRTFHKTIDGGELVTSEEGTGLVHIAPGAGHEDFVLGRKFELSTIIAIDEQAHFIDGFGFLTGRAAADSRPIINYLKKEKPEVSMIGWLVKQEQYTHRYPVCWRCETELVFRAVPEWYIAMDPIRNKMAEITKEITWIPEFARERELDWIRNMGDWLISKKRYWGLALPIWRCSACGWFTVIAGKEELKEKAVEGWEKFSGHSPHRPWIDEVKVICEKCGERASRIPDVGNPWLDAGIVPFSTLIDPKSKKVSYMTDKKYWQEWFPADFITESFPGQFKGWFYSLLAMSAVLENVQPFKTVLGHGTVLDEKGREMHKSWGNAIEFNEGADKMGADVMRWMYAKASPAQNLLFGYTLADQTRRNFHLPLWNVYNFFVTYANFDGWRPKSVSSIKYQVSSNILDKWILVRIKQVVQIVTESLDKYDAQTASSEIERFVDDLSTWYIRRSRERVGPSNTDTTDKEEFYRTTYFVLVTLSQLLAPFLPYLSEFIFTYLTHEESVHLTKWPETPAPDTREFELIVTMQQLREAVQVGPSIRKTTGIKLRQPLKQATVGAPSKSPTRPFLTLLAEELNVKEVVWKKKRVQKAVVTLNTRITPTLVEEGEARELVRRIQEERRRLGLGLADSVRVTVPHIPKDKKLFNWIKAKTLAQDLSQGDEFLVTKI